PILRCRSSGSGGPASRRAQPRRAWGRPPTPGGDGEVVQTAAEPLPAEFRDPQPAPLRAVFGGESLQAQHAGGDALPLQVVLLGRLVVQQQHRAFPADEKLLQRVRLGPPTAAMPLHWSRSTRCWRDLRTPAAISPTD